MDGRTSVLVVGAGPTGLALAADLARHGVACRVVDSAAAPTTLSKATSLQARTLEVLSSIGGLDEVLARGHRSSGVNVWSQGKPMVHFTYDDVDSPFPYMLNLPQSDVERILGGVVADRGLTVEREVRLVSFAQDAAGVTVQLAGPAGATEELTVDYLAGCDGAHSTVRHQLGVDFTGHQLSGWFALADVALDWGLRGDQLHGFVHPEGLLFTIPMPGGRHRVIVQSRPREGAAAEPTLAEIQHYVDVRGPAGATVSDPTWLTAFSINSRQAEHHRVGRVFLAGDAAHIHSPAGGQGMNTVIQDAYNLAWKLALVVRGDAPATLLDSYEPERAPVAAAVLRGTEALTRVLTTESHLVQSLRDHLGPVLTGLHPVRHAMATQDAEIDVSYRHSPLVDRSHGLRGVHAGDRVPDAGPLRRPDGTEVRVFDLLRGTSYVVLAFGAASAAALAEELEARYGSLVRVEQVVGAGSSVEDALVDASGAVATRYGAHGGALLLVRPDGYLAHRGDGDDAAGVLDHLDRVLTRRNVRQTA